MKTLDVEFINEELSTADIWEDAIGKLTLQKVKEVSWASYPYLPDVGFKIGYDLRHVYLMFYVEEKHLKAVYRETNQPVYKDSCVEFFLSFDGRNYYNLEFNSLGTALIGYGPSRESRKYLPTDLIEKIQTRSIINPANTQGGEGVSWNLQIKIPLEVFYAEQSLKLPGLTGHANFYKCGDDLPEPHYVSWNKIETPEPDFHRPEYFGEIRFIEGK